MAEHDELHSCFNLLSIHVRKNPSARKVIPKKCSTCMETLLAADYAEVDEMDIDVEDLTPIRPTTGVLHIRNPRVLLTASILRKVVHPIG